MEGWKKYTWQDREEYPLGLHWDCLKFGGVKFQRRAERLRYTANPTAKNGDQIWVSIQKGYWLENKYSSLYYVKIVRFEKGTGQVFRLVICNPYRLLFDAISAAEKEVSKWI